ncbi:MAG: DUF2461 domain-containing protein [Ilumatobacter sp.]
MTGPGPFGGFGPDALDFLRGLAADNSKAYFDAHRPIYESQIAAPMKSLVVEVGGRLAKVVDHDLQYEPRVGRSLFRINRDLRFSADKTPYQTHLDAIWWTGKVPKQSAAFILRLTPDSLLTGAGMRGLAGASLSAFRNAVAREPGVELAELVGALEREPGATRSDPSRKRVPKGFPADHQRADLLVCDGFHMSVEEPLPGTFVDVSFARSAADRLARFAALQTWFVAHV